MGPFFRQQSFIVFLKECFGYIDVSTGALQNQCLNAFLACSIQNLDKLFGSTGMVYSCPDRGFFPGTFIM